MNLADRVLDDTSNSNPADEHSSKLNRTVPASMFSKRSGGVLKNPLHHTRKDARDSNRFDR